ncbi:MAG TPA: O-antigen ligase family protein [Candidatus Binatia bacterium]|nr:O-antigen ligase family protein [Candidatus Binatia bacterium]
MTVSHATSRQRTLFDLATFGPPAMMAAFAFTAANVVGQAWRLVYAGLLLWLAPGCLRAIANLSETPLGIGVVVLFATMITAPVDSLLHGDGVLAVNGFREALYVAIWCSSFWLALTLVRTPSEMSWAIRRIDALGLLIAGSVYLSFAAQAVGLSFGEVIQSRGETRIFGLLGDATPFLLLFFLFREMIRGARARAALFAAPFLLGLPRGAILAFAIGLAYLATGDAIRFARRNAGRPAVRLLGTLLLVGASLVALLRFTGVGEMIRWRFELMAHSGISVALGDRLPSMRRAWGVFRENPVVGLGPGGYPRHVAELGLADEGPVSRRIDPSAEDTARPREVPYAQNQILQIAAEGGAIGLFGYGTFAVLALRTVRSARRSRMRDEALFFRAVDVFWIAVLFGVQTTVWLLDKATLGFFVFLLLGLASRQASMQWRRHPIYERQAAYGASRTSHGEVIAS